MRRTVTIWVGPLLFACALAGCGGSSSDEPSSTTPPSSAPAAASSATSSASSGSGGAATAAYTDAEACDWLTENLPKWADITDEVGVQAQLAIGLSSFFDEHGGLQNADGYAYDAATLRGCKAEHDQAVKLAGIKSFGNL